MQSSEIRKKYLEFFKKRGHAVIPSASLVPADYIIPDKGSLFTTAGMQPLIPYLLGEKHPAGTKIVDVQKCVRTGDIDDVGDNRHLTFFEMMGNWSLGDYFKKESIAWSLEFLTDKDEGLGLDPKRLYVTVFKGENGIPRDEDSISIWKENFKKHNIDVEISGEDNIIKDGIKIIPLGKEDNFWIAGQVGPCGADTEMFYDVLGVEKGGKLEGNFYDLVKSGRIIEIWNNVFMEFNKTSDGKYEKLAKPNVDTGMGLERTAVVMQEKDNVFETDIFEEILKYIKINSSNYSDKQARIIADHIRSSVFIISDGVLPSNTDSGYVLRKLLKRLVIASEEVDFSLRKISGLVEIIIDINKSVYSNLIQDRSKIIQEIERECEKLYKLGSERADKTLAELEEKFDKAMQKENRTPMRVRDVHSNKPLIVSNPLITGQLAFQLYSTYGVPKEKIISFANKKGYVLDLPGFEYEMKKHQEISKAGSEQKFKGGLAGTGEIETKYHTATHLLLASLRSVLKGDIVQKGSNITAERMRFDFNWPEKLTVEQLKAVEDLVNQKIAKKIPVELLELPKDEAKKIVITLSFDLSKYGDIVKVYKVGDFSAEFCGGPHVKNTFELGHFKIIKEEASSAGVRRIKAIVE